MAAGVKSNRIQNLAITLDKIYYILKRQPEHIRTQPPLHVLSPEEVLKYLWVGKDSVVSRVVRLSARCVQCSPTRRSGF